MANPISVKIGFTSERLLVFVGTIVMGAINAPWIRAQSQQSPLPKFEVVSIKPCDKLVPTYPKVSPNRLRLDCVTVEDLILLAYAVYPDGVPLRKGITPNHVLFDTGASVQSGPAWLRSKRFTIDAIANTPSNDAEKRGPLMQGVLKERFQLRLHEGSRPMAVYELAQVRGGAKLQPAKEGNCFEMDTTKEPPKPSAGNKRAIVCGGCGKSDARSVDCLHMSTYSLSRLLSNELQTPVVDRTGIAGFYDVHLDVAIEQLASSRMSRLNPPQAADSGNSEASTPVGSVLASLRKLGFQVKSAKGTAKVIVIDHLERPKEN